MVVSIGTSVLVPKSYHMTKFMNDNAKLVTIFTNGNSLRSVATFSNERAAATRSFSKHNVIGMLVSAFNELDACIIFPVSHCLFKKSSMITTKIGFDFIRNHCKIPKSFCSRCCCTGHAAMRMERRRRRVRAKLRGSQRFNLLPFRELMIFVESN